MIVVVPTRKIRIDQAITNAIDAVPGCIALMDGTVESKFWFIPYLYGEVKYVIEATPVVDPKMASISNNFPRFGKVYIDDDGEVLTIESISESLFLAEKRSVTKKGKKEYRDFTANTN